MIAVKHKTASRFVYNSGFFITTNVLPDFGDNVDGQAVRKRLRVFDTKELPVKDGSVSGRCFTEHIFTV